MVDADWVVTEKSGCWGNLRYAVVCSIGQRFWMEDTSVVQPGPSEGQFILAVFDGHSGPTCSDLCKEHFADILAARQRVRGGDVVQALRDTFLRLDLLTKPDEHCVPFPELEWEFQDMRPCDPPSRSGSTLLSCVVEKNRLVVANAGDCRALLGWSDGSFEVLTVDHKPGEPSEASRIEKTGFSLNGDRTYIMRGWSGSLGVSRAIGDWEYKTSGNVPWDQQAVVSVPDIVERWWTGQERFLFVASDGVFDTWANGDLALVIMKGIEVGRGPDEILQEIVQNSTGKDNKTAVLAVFSVQSE